MASKIVVDERGCWIWTGKKDRRGYGRKWRGGKERFAHRVFFEAEYGPIPDGMLVCHKCDVPSCVNPQHLFLGTPADNMADMWVKDRTKSNLSHAEWDEVRGKFETGENPRDIARQFGANRTAIYNMAKRRGWQRVSP